MGKNAMILSGIVFSFLLSSTIALDLDTSIKKSDEILSNEIKSVGGFINEDLGSGDVIVNYLYEKGISIHKTWEAFKPDQDIRRDEAAKMLTLSINYLENPLQTEQGNFSCEFSDQENAREDLRELIVESCNKGLFKGSNGRFKPDEPITNGQILTVVGRMLYGMQDESLGHYAMEYERLLENDGYLEGLRMAKKSMWNKSAKRGDIAKLLVKIIE